MKHLRAALMYRERGLAVAPLDEEGQTLARATQNPATVEALWEAHPQAPVGIQQPGLCAVVLDRQSQLDALCGLQCFLPDSKRFADGPLRGWLFNHPTLEDYFCPKTGIRLIGSGKVIPVPSDSRGWISSGDCEELPAWVVPWAAQDAVSREIWLAAYREAGGEIIDPEPTQEASDAEVTVPELVAMGESEPEPEPEPEFPAEPDLQPPEVPPLPTDHGEFLNMLQEDIEVACNVGPETGLALAIALTSTLHGHRFLGQRFHAAMMVTALTNADPSRLQSYISQTMWGLHSTGWLVGIAHSMASIRESRKTNVLWVRHGLAKVLRNPHGKRGLELLRFHHDPPMRPGSITLLNIEADHKWELYREELDELYLADRMLLFQDDDTMPATITAPIPSNEVTKAFRKRIDHLENYRRKHKWQIHLEPEAERLWNRLKQWATAETADVPDRAAAYAWMVENAARLACLRAVTRWKDGEVRATDMLWGCRVAQRSTLLTIARRMQPA